jgi:tight adherence protein C
MTTALLATVPGLVAVACVALFALGMRAMRADPVDGLDVGDLLLLRDERRRRAARQGPLDRLAAPLVPGLRRLVGPALEARLARMIELAGRPGGTTVETVLLRMAVWLLIMIPLALLLLVQGMVLGLLLAPVVVVVLPLARIARIRRLRQETIDTDLPDFLDVLAVTVTAGVGFRSALDTVGQRFGGPLGEEVALTLNQIRNGASVREAFVRLRARNDSASLSQFVTAFLQSEELGAPLAQTLNRIAQDMRRDNAQRQRQKAAKVAPRVTLVTSMVLVPGALAILVIGFIVGTDIDFGALLDGGLAP